MHTWSSCLASSTQRNAVRIHRVVVRVTASLDVAKYVPLYGHATFWCPFVRWWTFGLLPLFWLLLVNLSAFTNRFLGQRAFSWVCTWQSTKPQVSVLPAPDASRMFRYAVFVFIHLKLFSNFPVISSLTNWLFRNTLFNFSRICEFPKFICYF